MRSEPPPRRLVAPPRGGDGLPSDPVPVAIPCKWDSEREAHALDESVNHGAVAVVGAGGISELGRADRPDHRLRLHLLEDVENAGGGVGLGSILNLAVRAVRGLAQWVVRALRLVGAVAMPLEVLAVPWLGQGERARVLKIVSLGDLALVPVDRTGSGSGLRGSGGLASGRARSRTRIHRLHHERIGGIDVRVRIPCDLVPRQLEVRLVAL